MYPYDEIDPYMEPPLEPGLVLKNAAAKRKSAGNALTNNVVGAPNSVLPNAVDSYRSQANNLSDRAFKMMDTPLDYSGLQNFAKQRGEQGDSAMLNAMAAQFAGEGFAPMQEQFLKKASTSRDQIKMAGGMITPDGGFVKDPEASQDKQVNMLLQRSAQLAQIAETADTARERIAAQRAQQDVMAELRKMGLNLQQQSINMRRDALNNKAEPGNFTHEGYTPDNQRVVTNSKTGQSFIMGLNPNGTPSYTPYGGSATPKATYEKNVAATQIFQSKADSSDALINKIESNPGAFGITAAAISKLPATIQGRVGAKVLNENTLKLRADVLRQAAMEISDIYGAAQSVGEASRASTFIPAAEDPPEIVIEKLKAARDYARMNANAYGGAINQAVRDRSGGAQPSGNSGLSSDEAAELAQLRSKHRRETP